MTTWVDIVCNPIGHCLHWMQSAVNGSHANETSGYGKSIVACLHCNIVCIVTSTLGWFFFFLKMPLVSLERYANIFK